MGEKNDLARELDNDGLGIESLYDDLAPKSEPWEPCPKFENGIHVFEYSCDGRWRCHSCGAETSRHIPDMLTDAAVEVLRLRNCMKKAGLVSYMREGTPEEVAEHMDKVAKSWLSSDYDQKEEIETLKIDVSREQQLQLTAHNQLFLMREEVRRLQVWVDDLQSGMYVNCVYCGYRYGPKEDVPVTMADMLKRHISHCPKHPMLELRKEVEQFKKIFAEAAEECLVPIPDPETQPDMSRLLAANCFLRGENNRFRGQIEELRRQLAKAGLTDEQRTLLDTVWTGEGGGDD